MDTLKQNVNIVKPQTYQDKNFEFIQRLSERSKLKKEEELLNKNSEPKGPVFSNYTNGANKNAFRGANKFKTTSQLLNGATKSTQLQNQTLQQPILNAYSVCMDSIKPIKDEIVDLNTCQFETSIIPPPPSYQTNIQNLSVQIPPENPQNDADETGNIKLNYNKSYHKVDDDDDLAELDQFVKESDQDQKDFANMREKTETVCQNAQKAVGLDNKSLEDLKMVCLEQDVMRLQPKFIPESLFNLIDQMDECYDRSPSLQQDPSQPQGTRPEDQDIAGTEEIKETEFQFYEDGDVAEEDTFKLLPPQKQEESIKPGTNFPNMISPKAVKSEEKPSQQKETVLNFYEDEEVIECQSERPSIDGTNQSKMNDTINNFDMSMRSKMTISKEELYRIQKESYDETCIIGGGREGNVQQMLGFPGVVKAVSGLDILNQEATLNASAIVQQTRSVGASPNGLSSDQKTAQKTPHSRKIIRRKKSHTPDYRSSQVLLNNHPQPLKDQKQNKPDNILTGSLAPLKHPSDVKKYKTKEDRASDLMSSLKKFDINVDDLVKRMHQLPEKQMMIMLGVLKSVERGELSGIDDVKSFVASERSGEVVDTIEAKRSLPKPRRAKRILNTVTLANSQLSSSGGAPYQNPSRIPKDLKHK